MIRSKLVAWIVGILLALVYFGVCQVCPAQETAKPWEAGFLGSDDLVGLRVTYGDRAKVGGEVDWFDSTVPLGAKAWRVGFVGVYEVMQRQDFNAWLVDVPATLYVGGLGGVMIPEEGKTDATAALFTGFKFGGEKTMLGIEYQYLLTKDLWKELAMIDDSDRLLFYAAFRF